MSTTGLQHSRWQEDIKILRDISLLHLLQTGAVAFSDAHFGAGTGQIHKMVCNGRESRLVDCSSSICGRYESVLWGYRYFIYAVHTDDAGVRCQGIFS